MDWYGNEDDEEALQRGFQGEGGAGDLTLATLAAKHGVHHTILASLKRQAIEGMASTFSGAGDAAKAVGESVVEKLHAKIGQLVVERDLYVGSRVKRRAQDLRQTLAGCLFLSVEIGGFDRPGAGVRLAHQLISCSSMTACHNPACTAQTLKRTVSHFLPVHSHQSYSRSPSPRFLRLRCLRHQR